jgi:hypothetical protein
MRRSKRSARMCAVLCAGDALGHSARGGREDRRHPPACRRVCHSGACE